MSVIHELYGALTDTYDEAKYPLGSVYQDPTTGNFYRFVVMTDAVDGAVAKFAVMSTTGNWYVTIDYADGTALGGDGVYAGVGMLLATVDISEAPYCWVQISGITTFTAGSAAIVAGDLLVPDAGEDGDLEEDAALTNAFARSLATVADDATGLCLLLNCM